MDQIVNQMVDRPKLGDDGSDGGWIEVGTNDLGDLKGEQSTEGCRSTTGASSGIYSVCSSDIGTKICCSLLLRI